MSGLDDMKKRLDAAGGYSNGRNVSGKLRSFHKALDNSYNSEWVTLYHDDDTKEDVKVHCLINPSRLTEEFDRKVISVDYNKGISEGTVFYWDRTDRYWIVDLQQHTEEAYFRGLITRCDNQADINGHKYWITLKGPSETDISWTQKHGLYFNNLNYSLAMTITKNKETLDYFSRFNIVKVCYTYKDDEEVVEEWHKWQVAATDKYSSENIIEVYLNEYADNAMEDSMIEPKEIPHPEEGAYIAGPQFVKAWDENISYSIVNSTDGEFVINSNKVKIVNMNKDSLKLNILTGKSGEFEILYRKENEEDIKLKVNIQSL